MAKRLIGHYTQFGVQDTTGVNPYLPGTGWNVLFTPDVLAATRQTEIEVFHISLDGPVGSSAALLLDSFTWDFVSQAWSNGWDPSQPMLVWQSATLAICWNVAFTAGPYNKTTNIRPVATVWARYETPAPPTILPGLGG